MSAPDAINIAIFGAVNTGKSTLFNTLFSHKISVVSSTAGTTTDVVKKSIEIHPLGRCVVHDTPGICDKSSLGALRLEKTLLSLDEADVALFVISALVLSDDEKEFVARIVARKIPFAFIYYPKGEKADADTRAKCDALTSEFSSPVIQVSRENFTSELQKLVPSLMKDFGDDAKLLSHLVKEGDTVLLVMPQDEGAPKNRLILPQQQTIRELLDCNCVVISCTPEGLDRALCALDSAPSFCITDSKVFQYVYNKVSDICPITSFSVLFAYYKGYGDYALSSAKVLSALTKESKVLIAECCSHAPINEDIGRVVIPRMLKKFVSDELQIDFCFGTDFPKDLKKYQLVIQCGGCMFNRAYIASRVQYCKSQKVPMTNYGMAIAYINGILDKIKL